MSMRDTAASGLRSWKRESLLPSSFAADQNCRKRPLRRFVSTLGPHNHPTRLAPGSNGINQFLDELLR